MAIKKEWHCDGCGTEFESAIDLCKRCGAPATRVFRTPVGIGKGSAKKIDALLERNFKKRGISNYTNIGGSTNISWAKTPRAFPEGDWRAGGWGKDQLERLNADFGTGFKEPVLSGPKALTTQVAPDNPQAKDKAWGQFVQTEIINSDGAQ